eukprot:s1331_g35.t1
MPSWESNIASARAGGTPASPPSESLILPPGALASDRPGPGVNAITPTAQSGMGLSPMNSAVMVASLQNGSMAWSGEEATLGKWRRDVKDLAVLFQETRAEEDTARHIGEPLFASVSFMLPTPSGTEEDSAQCCGGLSRWRPQTYEWLTGRMSASRKNLLVFFFMVLEGVRLIVAKNAFVPGVNMLSILVVENCSSLILVGSSVCRRIWSLKSLSLKLCRYCRVLPAVACLRKCLETSSAGSPISSDPWGSWHRRDSDVIGLEDALQKAKICFLGLDNAGKTTLLQMLRDGRLSVNAPTLYPSNEELNINGIRFRTFDLGGHETARRIWKDYLSAVDGIIFLVDAADRTRFQEAAEELGRLLDDPALARVPFVVLGNKIDIPVAASEDELRHSLGLYTHMTSGKYVNKGEASVRPLELFMCSVVKRMGYAEAFDWLAKLV